MQCKTCGVRFGATEREALRVHMDKHFRQNQRGKQAGIAPASRRWLLPLEQWVGYVFDEKEPVTGKAPVSVFDALSGVALPPKAEEAPKPVPVLRAPSEVTRLGCALCGEAIEMFYDDALCEWMLRDAVPAPPGTAGVEDPSTAFAHSACVT